MKPSTFAKLAEAIEKVIQLENEDRSAMVYDELSTDMAEAAQLVYDSCLKGQVYAEHNSV